MKTLRRVFYDKCFSFWLDAIRLFVQHLNLQIYTRVRKLVTLARTSLLLEFPTLDADMDVYESEKWQRLIRNFQLGIYRRIKWLIINLNRTFENQLKGITFKLLYTLGDILCTVLLLRHVVWHRQNWTNVCNCVK